MIIKVSGIEYEVEELDLDGIDPFVDELDNPAGVFQKPPKQRNEFLKKLMLAALHTTHPEITMDMIKKQKASEFMHWFTKGFFEYLELCGLITRGESQPQESK